MQRYEYKVVPAPAKGTKAKGVKTPEGRFANTVEILLNELATGGWEFQRAELLPSEERSGLTGSTTNWRNVLVFRRELHSEEAEAADEARVPAPFPVDIPSEPALEVSAIKSDETADKDSTVAHPVPGPGAVRMQSDDGVEELSPVSGMTQALKTRAEQQSDDDPEKA
ncbi:MAG: DUF4177 domain-containing protein [Rhodobacteraceae bacterium]|nr:DUF4177 domain-containing protein [Paracoccaceae bacterium]